jgi:hypothetical protein
MYSERHGVSINFRPSLVSVSVSSLVRDAGPTVVRHGDDRLQLELTLSHDRCLAGTVVCVLPLDPRVDLMDADTVVLGHHIAVGVDNVTRQVGDDTEAIATDYSIVRQHCVCVCVFGAVTPLGLTRKVVGGHTRADVTQVESALAVEGVSWVPVRDKHLRQGEAVEHRSSVEGDIVQDHPLSPVETWSNI